MKKILLYSVVVISGAILFGFYKQKNATPKTPEEYMRRMYEKNVWLLKYYLR